MKQEISINDALVNNYFDIVTPVDGDPLGLIVSTNAGSQTFLLIASALKQLESQSYDLVVLVGTSQDKQPYIQRDGLLRTPLGDLEVAGEIADQLLQVLQNFKPATKHIRRASELVEDSFSFLGGFLKHAAPLTKVVPVLLPEDGLHQAETLGNGCAEILKDLKAVMIAQADLDEVLLSALEYNDPEVFSNAVKMLGHQSRKAPGQPRLSVPPAAAALTFAAAMGGNTVSVLERASRNNLIQAAVMLWNYQPPKLSPEQTNDLLELASKAIEAHITSGAIPEYYSPDPEMARKTGVFVTLRINGMLRGCIGHMSADRPLALAVQEMAVAAATSDPRFPPLSTKEFDQITLKIAVLSPLQRINPEQVEVGKHGLLIAHQGRRGVLLPEVASDRGWDRETFLQNLCFKAGLAEDAWRQNAKLYAFTSIVFGNE